MFPLTISYSGIQQSFCPIAGLLTAQSQDWTKLKAEEQRLVSLQRYSTDVNSDEAFRRGF